MNFIGKVLDDRYEIIEEVGCGGMAVVYKARCKLLNRFVAVKILRDDLISDNDAQEFIHRFNIESQAAASLSHPNIVSIFDVGNENNVHYIVMEYVEGITLKDYLKRQGQLPWREAVDFACQICKGLEQAHRNSIIHRDIKPHNIIVTPDKVLKVTDFGIARAATSKTVTLGKNAIGSVHYFSPEQARGGYTDEKSDIYSLGIVIYEMLTGNIPFDSDSPIAIALKHIQEQPIPPREHNLSIPLIVEKIILKAMCKEQSGRYSSVTYLLKDLENSLIMAENTKYIAEEENSGTIKLPVTDLGRLAGTVNAAKEAELSADIPRRKVRVPAAGDDMAERTHKKNVNSKGQKKKERIAALLALLFAFLILGLGAFFLFNLFSGGSSDIAVPDLVGENINDVLATYNSGKFKIIETERVESDKPEHTIVSQNPAAKRKVKDTNNIEIKVTVSKGKIGSVEIEDYVRKDYKVAQRELENMGFVVEVIQEYSENVPIDMVTSQSPEGGEKPASGSKIVLYVSKGPNTSQSESPSPSPTPSTTPEPSASTQPSQLPSQPPGNTSSANPSSPPSSTKTASPTATTPSSGKVNSTIMTFQAPSGQASTQIRVEANGKVIHDQPHKPGEAFDVRIESSSSSATVKIYHNNVLKGTQAVTLE